MSFQFAAILTLAVASFGYAGGDGSEVQKLYEQAREAKGPEYVKARDAFLAQGSLAVDLLKDRARSAPDPTKRWEAEALLARAQNPDEFARLGKAFAERVARLKGGYSGGGRYRTGAPSVRLDTYSGLLLPEETSPFAQVKDRRHLGLPEDQVKFIDSLRITDSPLWPAVLAEVFLKGWVAADPTIRTPPEQIKVKRSSTDLLNGFNGPPAREDYFIQAMLLLAKRGEDRIVPKATAILKDPAFTLQDRSTAARALGLVKEPTALDTLLELAADASLPDFLQQRIFMAIGEKKDPKAIPFLEQMIAVAPKVRSPNELTWGPWYRGSAARHAKEAILTRAGVP
jgi:HEAT repeats